MPKKFPIAENPFHLKVLACKFLAKTVIIFLLISCSHNYKSKNPITNITKIAIPSATTATGKIEITYTDFVWLPDNRLALSSGIGVMVYSLNLTGIEPQANPQSMTLAIGKTQSMLTASPSGLQLAWVESENSAYVWDTSGGKNAEKLTANENPLTGLAFDFTDRRLVLSSYNGDVSIWDLMEKRKIVSWQSGTWLSDLSVSPDGKNIAGADLSGFKVMIFTPDGNFVRELEWVDSASPSLYAAVFSPDWSRLAWVAREVVQIMDAGTGNLGPQFIHEDFVAAYSWSPDSKRFVSVSTSLNQGRLVNKAFLWDTNSGVLTDSLILESPIQSLSFSPDSSNLALLTSEGNLLIWRFNK